MRRNWLAALLAVCILFTLCGLAGCGGDDGAEEPGAKGTPAGPSSAEPSEEPSEGSGLFEDFGLGSEPLEIPLPDYTQDYEYTDSGDCGDDVWWGYDEEHGALVIGGSGEMENYFSSSEIPWLDYAESIEAAVIEDGVTSIGNRAFSYCNALKNVTIPGSVTNLGGAFAGCTGLKNVTIPDSVTSISADTFSNCTGLEDITIPGSVTSLGDRAFARCSSLTNITIPASVTRIGYCAFSNCTNINEVFYAGTGAQWESIDMDDGNIFLTRSAVFIHYNSAG